MTIAAVLQVLLSAAIVILTFFYIARAIYRMKARLLPPNFDLEIELASMTDAIVLQVARLSGSPVNFHLQSIAKPGPFKLCTSRCRASLVIIWGGLTLTHRIFGEVMRPEDTVRLWPWQTRRVNKIISKPFSATLRIWDGQHIYLIPFICPRNCAGLVCRGSIQPDPLREEEDHLTDTVELSDLEEDHELRGAMKRARRASIRDIRFSSYPKRAKSGSMIEMETLGVDEAESTV